MASLIKTETPAKTYNGVPRAVSNSSAGRLMPYRLLLRGLRRFRLRADFAHLTPFVFETVVGGLRDRRGHGIPPSVGAVHCAV